MLLLQTSAADDERQEQEHTGALRQPGRGLLFSGAGFPALTALLTHLKASEMEGQTCFPGPSRLAGREPNAIAGFSLPLCKGNSRKPIWADPLKEEGTGT